MPPSRTSNSWPSARDESFKVWSHGYPYRTVRWHFHPEYEIHLITATTGKYFVGDYIGDFEASNLVMTGPNLPHNWVSNVPRGEEVRRALSRVAVRYRFRCARHRSLS